MKEIKEKVLPPLDDELARSASEFDTLDELRADVEQRLREQLEADADEAFRRATLDQLVEASNVRVSRAARRRRAPARCCASSTR